MNDAVVSERKSFSQVAKMRLFMSSKFLICAVIGIAQALPRNHTDASVNAIVDAGTFQNPSVNVRPRFRYWVPDASVDHDVLAEDIKEAGRVGAGGVEILGYYLYGGTPQGTGNFSPSDWSVYGWGTPEWQKAFNVMAQAHADNGLIMDFAMGPNQGQGVPAPEDSDGLMWDLFPYNITIPVGGSFNGTIPGWNEQPTGSLLAVISGEVVSSQNITVGGGQSSSLNSTADSPGPPIEQPPSSRTQKTLSLASLRVLTDQVTADGGLSVTFPSNSTAVENNLFVIYLIHNDYRAQEDPIRLGGPQTEPQTFLQNGSWAVDHFSSLGARTITDFWENHVLTNGTRELVMEVGNYGWEDSIETRANVFWTKGYSDVFSSQHGYDLTKWLPILFHSNRIGFSPEPPTWWVTDEDDAGNRHIADYRDTLTKLYNVYVRTLNEWAHEYLGVQFSAQVAYNLPMDMMDSVPEVDAPECESLGFNHLIDGYRQYAGPANLAGKRIISTECGAIHLECYQQTIPELLWDVKRSIAGSVNQFVFHGLPYSGQYGNTTWPGFTTFDYSFSEMHGKRQPDWDYISDAIDFSARLSFIFQSGIPKMDVAFYQKFTAYEGIVRNYQPTDLEEAGFSYEYLSPENFNIPEAVVQNGTLAPTRQAFKAMVVRANDSMTISGVQKIAEFAHAGLPVIFSGGLPTMLLTADTVEDDYVLRVLEPLSTLPNVHITPFDGLASTLGSIGIAPLTKVSANHTWFTYWRRDDIRGMDFIFVYNDGESLGLGNGFSEGTVEFASVGTPYLFDAWTGVQTPISNFSQSDNTTTIFFQIAGNQSIIVAFADTPLSLNTTAPNITSTGSAIKLSNWSLTVESWEPSSDLFDIETTVKTNSTRQLSSLDSWQDIPGLQNVSGLGFYNTSFSWPPSNTNSSQSAATGAIIDFGAIIHTLRVKVNGNQLPPLDPTWARADITKFLQTGQNDVEAVISTPLLNVMLPIWDKLLSSGGPSEFGPATPQDYGLVGAVKVTPYQTASG